MRDFPRSVRWNRGKTLASLLAEQLCPTPRPFDTEEGYRRWVCADLPTLDDAGLREELSRLRSRHLFERQPDLFTLEWMTRRALEATVLQKARRRG